jgi:hypothetical protein
VTGKRTVTPTLDSGLPWNSQRSQGQQGGEAT